MGDPLADRFRRWSVYEQESHIGVLGSLHSVPIDRRFGAAFQQAIDLLAHVAAARLLWLHRLGGWAEPVPAIFPTGTSLMELAEGLERAHAAWEPYLGGLDAAELARAIEYRSLDGGVFRSEVADVLTQLFTHSAYHRGQVAALVRSLDGEPAPTDFIYWSREPVAQEARVPA